jgi:zinc transport system substrate-binding protein
MPQAVDMMRSVNNADVRTEILESGGSWLVPEVQQRAVRDIAAILAALRPEDAHGIGRRAEKRILEVDRTEEECRAKLSAVDGKAVVVAAMQGEFVRWAGLDVLESYKRAEEMTPRDIALLIDKLRGRAISGVIDNYQSGANTGLPLALELEIPHIVLSNFPGSSEDTPDYFHLLRHNVEQLLKLGR